MSRLFKTSLALSLLLWLGPQADLRAEWAPGQLEIMGLMVGRNDGGADLERLRYAERDAEKVRDVFVELGGISEKQAQLLLAPDVKSLRAAFRRLDRQIRHRREDGGRVLLVFFYSGHAKDGALRLGAEELDMAEISRWLEHSPADVRIGFVDSCQSGEMTRQKGGALLPSILELEEHTSGHIIMTSSSARESSQESDEIGGSFFTHYLVSGLRGSADSSGDGSVSLKEIYEFAYNRTVNRTASSRAGTQHPTYGYKLSGRGEIILTRASGSPSGLVFAEDQAGSYLVYDLEKERIAAEVEKKAGERQSIALLPGRYIVKKRRTRDLLIGQLEIRTQEHLPIHDKDLHPTAFEDDLTKGLVVLKTRDWRVAYSFRFGTEIFFDAPTREDLFYDAWQGGMQVEFLDLLGRNWSLALDLLLAAGRADTHIETDLGFTEDVETEFSRFLLGLSVNYHLDWRRIGLYAGPRLSFLMASRSFGEPFEGRPAQTFGTICPGMTAGAVIHLGDFDFFAEGRLHYLYYNMDEDASLGFGGVYLGLAYRH